MKTGGQLIVDCLAAQGVERVFSVPGESYLAVLDALYDSGIENVVCRQEGGAAIMAEAMGKMTGRPGVAMVTRGPGATNASAGVHIARQDSTPMVLFVGQVERRMRGRGAFQEVDYVAIFGNLAKHVEEITFADQVPEVLGRAWAVAMNGRPGPVVLSLPEDMLSERAEAVAGPRVVPTAPAPSPGQVTAFGELLAAARAPVTILGGSRWDDGAVAAVENWAARWSMPVGTVFRRQNLFDNAHGCYAGDVGLGLNPALKARIENADLLILLGTRMSEQASGAYTLLGIPKDERRIVHVHADADELGRVHAADLAIQASPGTFLDAVAGQAPVAAFDAAGARADFEAWTENLPRVPGPVEMGEVMGHLRKVLPEDAIVTNGAGNYAIWLHRFWRCRRYDGYLGPTSGSMGYGLPAAVAAKLALPDRLVLCLAGDGCFQMTCQEFGTAAQEGAAVVVLVIDNGIYGTIRMHQERDYPGRVSGTVLDNPDFAALARAYGGHGEIVEDAGAFGPAFDRAVESGIPAIVHVKVNPEAITPTMTIEGLRQKAT